MNCIKNPIFIFKENNITIDEKKIFKFCREDLRENECQWEDLEIVETQSKLEVTGLILDQLYNEIIEILEHIQLSRKNPNLYLFKSIYSCDDIPKLSFQKTIDNDFVKEGKD